MLVAPAVVMRPVTDGPGYTKAGELKYPAKYREWVFLTSGIDMNYTAPTGAGAGIPEHSVFDNVFVNPEAYRAFVGTGHWPVGTVMVLENRGAEGNHSINVRGKTQSEEMRGFEVHALRADGWGFYSFSDTVSAKEIAHTASCYSCHEQHAAVDTTFVQFYPTLMPVAKGKGTLSAAFLKEEAGRK